MGLGTKGLQIWAKSRRAQRWVIGHTQYPLNHAGVIKWKHFLALLAISAGNSPVPGEFPTQRPVMRSFDVYFDLRPNKRLNKQSWGWWFETSLRPLWRHRSGVFDYIMQGDIMVEFWHNVKWSCFITLRLTVDIGKQNRRVASSYKIYEWHFASCG